METNDSSLFWASTNGGPLILIDREFVESWEGIHAPSGGRVAEAKFRWNPESGIATDYDRACDASDEYVGRVDVGLGQGFVLGDAPDQTTWWPLEQPSVGMLVRWGCANSDEDVVKHLPSAASALWEPVNFELVVVSGKLLLFDSAFSGADALDANDVEPLSIEVPVGTYGIETAVFEPDDETNLILHRLTLKS